MDEETVSSNLNSLKEMILDEEKPVTYFSISKDLCLHVNAAKHLLALLVEDIKKKALKTPINVSYIISGLKDGNNATTKICSEAELPDERKLFEFVFFEHIYGVSKGVPFLGNGIYMTINRFEDFSLCQGLIKNNLCSKRSSEEIGSLKSNSQQKVQAETKITPRIKSKEENKELNGHNNAAVVKIQESKSEPTIRADLTSPKKDSSNNKKNGPKNSKGIAGFFTKSNSAPNQKVMSTPKESIKSDPAKTKNSGNEMKFDKMETEDLNVEGDSITLNEKKAKTLTKQNKMKGNSSTEKLDKIKKTAKVDKKRKRLLHVSDSESDDEGSPFVSESLTKQTGEMEYDSADEIPPTPTVNTVKITSGIVNPKKRRKIVDKTYTDEEGYILTKKVEVYESCSENEDEVGSKENKIEIKAVVKTEHSPKEKKQAPKTGKKKISPPQKGKQATLTNFFKKV